MKETKKRISELLKTHINYISIIIFFIGLTLKYSIPSLFPFSKKIDVIYFGSLLIEYSVIFFIGNFMIDKYKEEINKNMFSDIIDKKIGLSGKTLISELVNLISPFQYEVIDHNVINHITKLNKKQKRYDIVQTINLKLVPKQDNVHYIFGVGTTDNKQKIKLEYVKLNGKKLMNEDIRELKSPYLQDMLALNYQLITPLKENKQYIIEIKLIYQECMSDLNDGTECDFHEYTYFALTHKTKLIHIYDFPNFDGYSFKAEKRYMNLPNVDEIEFDDPKKNEIIIESANLKNGDRIYVCYTKKTN